MLNSNRVDNTDAAISGLLCKLTPNLNAEINFKMDLAAKIFAGMKAKGWNQTEFARQMNVSNSVITKWLSGYNNFEADILFAIQNKLNITLYPTQA